MTPARRPILANQKQSRAAEVRCVGGGEQVHPEIYIKKKPKTCKTTNVHSECSSDDVTDDVIVSCWLPATRGQQNTLSDQTDPPTFLLCAKLS